MNVEDTAESDDNIRIETWNRDELLSRWPDWDDLSDKEKLHRLREHRPEEAHEETVTDHNVTCHRLDELHVETLNKSSTDPGHSAEEFVVGNENRSPKYTNDIINNEVGRVDIVEYEADGSNLIMNGLLGTEELNEMVGELVEIGTVTGDDDLLNHATYSAVDKTEQRAVTYQVTLKFDAAGEEVNL